MQADCWRYRLPITPECLLPIDNGKQGNQSDIDEEDKHKPRELFLGLAKFHILPVVEFLHPLG
jgi:hypothetical protein